MLGFLEWPFEHFMKKSQTLPLAKRQGDRAIKLAL